MTEEDVRKLAEQLAEYSLSEEKKMYDNETYLRLLNEASKGLFDPPIFLAMGSQKLLHRGERHNQILKQRGNRYIPCWLAYFLRRMEVYLGAVLWRGLSKDIEVMKEHYVS